MNCVDRIGLRDMNREGPERVHNGHHSTRATGEVGEGTSLLFPGRMAYTAGMNDFSSKNGPADTNVQSTQVPRSSDRYEAFVEGPSRMPNGALLHKVCAGGFSWCTFFLGAIYWAYRKCYVEAVALLLFNTVMGFLPATPVWAFLGLASNIALSFAFFPLYRWHVDRLHAKILTKETPGGQRAIEAVRAQGGTSMLAVLILLAVVFAVAVLELFMLGPSSGLGTSKPAF